MMKVGITGGIGSGKSTVCHLFARLGVAVYDSDAGAKRLMTEDAELRRRITDRFGAEAYADGTLNRTYLAGRVFSEAQALADLNAIVHPAVRADFAAWAERQEGDYVILESALLFDAGFDACVDRTVAVLAPEALRIERTCRRDGCGADQVVRRIAAQLDDDFLGGFQPQPLDVFQQHGVACGDDALQFARRIGRKNHTRRIAPHARNADQQAEQLALGFGREAVEQLRILAHDVMDVEPGLGLVFDRGVGFERNMEVVAHPADVDNCVSGSHFGDCALDVFVHVFQILLRVGQK